MTPWPLRAVLSILGGILLVAAIVLAACGVIGPAIGAAVWAALLFIGVAFERWRYKPLTGERLGPDWVATDERFVDPESGKLVQVYFHPTSGERRYIAVG